MLEQDDTQPQADPKRRTAHSAAQHMMTQLNTDSGSMDVNAHYTAQHADTHGDTEATTEQWKLSARNTEKN